MLLPQVLASRGDVIKRTPFKSVTRHSVLGRTFYVKRYLHAADPFRPLKYLVRPPRSRLEWRMARRLAALGVSTVEHWAHGERWSLRGLIESILVTEGPPGFSHLPPPTAPLPDALQAALGLFIRRMHDAGVLHRDLHPDNLLHNPVSGEFKLVDLDKMSVGRPLTPEQRREELLHLHRQMTLGPEFAKGYGRDEASDLPAEAALRLRRQISHRRSRRCLRANRDFQHRRAGPITWRVRAEWAAAGLETILRDPDQAFESSNCLKSGSAIAIGRIQGFIVKRYRPDSAWGLFKGLFRQSPARRAFRTAYHLELNEIPTARAIALGERRLLGAVVCSYFVSEEIPGATPIPAWHGDLGRAGLALAPVIARMHNAGLAHRDLKESNILMDANGVPHLVDMDGIRFVGELSAQREARDLARLARGMLRHPGLVRRTLAARFLHAYTQARGRDDWRPAWLAVRRLLAERPPQPWFRLPGPGRGHVLIEWEEDLAAAGWSRTSDFLEITGEPLRKPGLGRRHRARLHLTHHGSPAVVYLKRYDGEPPQARIRRLYEHATLEPAALREASIAQALLQAGIPTPRPVAWGAVGSRSYVIFEPAEGEALERWLSPDRFPPGFAGFQRKRSLVRAVAKLTRGLHDLGWVHRDYYLSHLFVAEHATEYRLSLIDLQRAFRPRWRANRWRVKDLAQLNYSTPPAIVPRTLRIRFLLDYLGHDRLSTADRSLVRRILARTQAMEVRNQRRVTRHSHR